MSKNGLGYDGSVCDGMEKLCTSGFRNPGRVSKNGFVWNVMGWNGMACV